jgi:penicillin-binding protein 1A
MNSNNTAVSDSKAGKKKQRTSVGRIIGNIIRILFLIGFTIGVIVAGIVGGAVFAYIKTAEPITADQLAIKNQTTYIYDSKNNEILALQGVQNREMVDSSDIPRHLKNAFVAIEDKRFPYHSGVDFKRFASAVINFVLPGGESHGGSTITQQVVKNVTGEDRRSIKRRPNT